MKAEGRKAPSMIPPQTACGGWDWQTKRAPWTGMPFLYAAVFFQGSSSRPEFRLVRISRGRRGKAKFLLVCLQYDAIYRTLPDPVWWISGNPAAAELFAEGFIARLKQLDQDK